MPVRTRNGILFLDFRFREIRCRISTHLSETAENQKFAGDWDATIRREIALGTFRLENHFPHLAGPGPSEITFKDTADEWLKAHQHTWAEWTYIKHRDNLKARIYPKIGKRIFSEITANDLRVLRGQVIEEGKIKGGKLSNRTVNRIMQPVMELYNEKFEDGEIENSPAARIKKMKEKRIAEIDPFSEEELVVLFGKAREHFPWYAAYIRHLFRSGFRLEENNGLRWPRINLVTDTISIREVIALRKLKDPKTENAIRDVEITPAMREALIEQKARSYLRYEFVWVTENGTPIDISNFRARVWEPLLKKAELKYRWPNQARHTFATMEISKNKDPRWIAKQMGTSLEMLFETYTAIFDRMRGHSRGHSGENVAVRKGSKSE